jgi:tRNA (guanine-N7-)-methyltransferase
MERPSNRSYSLRGNRMTRAQSLAMDQHWDQYSLNIEEQLLLNQVFPDKQKVILEIGSGMGEATAAIAQSSPDTGYVAVEMHQPGHGALLLLIIENKINNLKLIREDATYLLANFIPDNSIDGIHLLFPDPWPKNRQHKRRIVQSEFVEMIAQKLKPKALFTLPQIGNPMPIGLKRALMPIQNLEAELLPGLAGECFQSLKDKVLKKDMWLLILDMKNFKYCLYFHR